ncbi:MAG: histidine kinase [Verrucomicrobiaceae bacterium]|nr:histidine kinase [Verrucomicrobiaceae bacterium]
MTTSRRLDQIASRFRKPNPERLAWELPLRAQLVSRLLILSGLAELSLLVLGYAGVIRSAFFPWASFESLFLLLISAWYARKKNVVPAAALLLVSLSHAAAFIITSYGPRSAAPALLLPTIIISGLVTGRYFLAAWWAICVAILVWVSAASFALDLQAILFWSAGYAATAYLIWLFASHLERLLEAASRSGEERREAVVEERMRLAREIHDTLAQGFTGIVVQINAAEQIASDKNAETWNHLEKARTLARRSLDEARRSMLSLRASDLPDADLLREIERTGRHLLVDESIQLEVVREGKPYLLPNEIETELLRVGQEAVANAIRHSGAKKILISLHYLPHEVMLRVSDDGKGSLSTAPGLGIQGMEERMRRVRGKLEIITRAQVGTAVCATVAV